jgi:anthranilate phosphoribosyltransferase
MIDLLQQFGKGRKGPIELTYEEAARAADCIFDRKATLAQTAAFLMAQQLMTESSDEIIAFVHSLRSRAIPCPARGGIESVGPSVGLKKTFMASLPSAFVLSACRMPVTMQSSPALSLQPHSGMTATDILMELDIPVSALSLDQWFEGASSSDFLFIPTELWCPPLARLRSLRDEIGIPTLLNTAEQLLRPSYSPYIALGIQQGTAYVKAAQLLQRLNVQRALIIQDAEGSGNVPTDRRSRIIVLRDEVTNIHIIDPKTFGLHTATPVSQWTAHMQARTTIDVLRCRALPAYRNIVLLNCALRLWITERAESIEEGIQLAVDALDYGLAWKHYTKWREGIGAPLNTMSN